MKNEKYEWLAPLLILNFSFLILNFSNTNLRADSPQMLRYTLPI